MSSQGTMRAVDIRPTDGGDIPATAMWINPDSPKPKPTGTQALVRIRAFGLNRMDLMQRENKYPLPPQAPKTMGVEFQGRIEELGSDADDKGESFKVGDEVFGLAYGGTYSPFVLDSAVILTTDS
jgi:NADPH:quinone reductase-like Zn-dependent oxidoreductase